MDRRRFLGTMTAATILSRQLSWAAGDHKIDKVGLQLYTIRSVMKDDFEGKLAKVAEIGYREVEFAGYDDHTPQEVRAMLDRHGLTGPSAHIPYKSLGAEFPGVLDAAHVVGHRYLVNPYIDDDVRKGPESWNPIRISQSLVRIHTGQRKTSLRHSAGRVRSQAGENGNGPVLDHGRRSGSLEVFQALSGTVSPGAREGPDEDSENGRVRRAKFRRLAGRNDGSRQRDDRL